MKLLTLAITLLTATGCEMRIPGFCRERPIGHFVCESANLDNDDFTSLLLRLPLNLSYLEVSAPCCDQKNYFTLSQDLSRFPAMGKLKLTKGTIQYFGANLFADQNELEELDVSDNIITHLAADSFTQLRRLKRLNLSNNRMGKAGLPSGYFSRLKNLTSLDLSSNFIQRIHSGAFQGLSSLDNLNLANNPLNMPIQPKTFIHMKNLRSLNLRNTGITQLSREVFKYIKGLQELDLSRNQLNIFPHAALLALAPTLVSLDVSANQITKIPGFLFSDWNLKAVKLSRNRLHQGIDENAFAGSNITSLAIGSNQLTYKDLKAVLKLSSALEELDISNNPLKGIQGLFFKRFWHLRSLSLAETDIFHLPNLDAIFHAPLGNLNLSRNQISDAGSAHFYRLPDLHSLDLSTNRLKSLDSRHIKYFQSLRALYLSGNPFKCGCRIFELKTVLHRMIENHQGDPLSLDFDNVRCASPDEVKGQPIINVSDSDVPMCSAIFGAIGLNDQSEISILIIASGAVALVFVLVVTVLCSYYLPKMKNRETRHSMSAATSENSDFGADRLPIKGQNPNLLAQGTLPPNCSPANMASLTSTLISRNDRTPIHERKAFILDVDL